MVGFIWKRKKLVLLFTAGFLVGVFLELTFVEELRFPFYPFLGEPRVACLVLLKHPRGNLNASESTWLKKCDELHVFSIGKKPDDTCDGSTKVIAKSAWSGLCKVIRRISHSDCGWFILMPDSLMVVVENLKKFVWEFNSDEDHYYGHAIGHYEGDYNALSAGVLLSRGTVRRLSDKFTTDEDCDAHGKYWRNEDVFLGKYLKEMGIVPKDTRDSYGRGRFHGYNINVLLSPGKLFRKSDYTKKSLYPVPEGFNCCSPELITLDVADSDRMYHHYYYLYRLTTEAKHMKSMKTSSDGPKWKDFLREEGYDEATIANMTDEEYYQIWAKKISPEMLYEKMRKDFGS